MTCILVDLDGTVCNAQHRAHMISGIDGEPNWDDYSLACSADIGEALPHPASMGYGTDFAQRSQARPTVWPNRVHVDHLR